MLENKNIYNEKIFEILINYVIIIKNTKEVIIMNYENVKLGPIDRFKVYLKRREAEKTEDERRKYEPNDDYNPDYSRAEALENELLNKKIAKLKAKDEKRQAKQNKRNHVQMLPEGGQTYKETPNNLTQYELKQTPRYVPTKGTLDDAIYQYLQGAVFMAQNKGYYDSYKVLTNLGASSSQEHGKNLQNEKNLIQNLENRQRQTNNFVMQRQPKDPTKETNFFHVQKNLNFFPEKRIYLNCQKRNIAALAYNLMGNFEDLDSYYLKFCSDKQAREFDRSEQIVIYIKDDKQLMDIVTRIEKTKMEFPKLFEGSRNINPFIKNYGGYIAYANQPQKEEVNIEDLKDQTIAKMSEPQVVYEDMVGGNKFLKASYNEVLATALEEAIVYGVNSIMDNDPSFLKTVKDMKLGKGAIDNSSAYVQAILPEILKDDKKSMQMVANMKVALKALNEKNPILDIKGIDDEKQQQSSVDYFK